MNARQRALQHPSSRQHYIRVDDEVEILVDKPLAIKMEESQYSITNNDPLSSAFKKDSEHKPDIIEYADDCPEINFKTFKAFYTPAQLVPKKRGKKNPCLLINSIKKKVPVELQPSENALIPQVNGNKLDNNSVCDSNKLLNRDVRSLSMPKVVRPSQSKRLWKKDEKCYFNKIEINGNSKFPNGEEAKSLSKIEPISFYNSQSPMHVVNEADIPPFTPSPEISCSDASTSSCMRQPDVVYLKTKPASRVIKSRLFSRKKKKSSTVNRKSNQESNGSVAMKKEPLQRKKCRREMNALYENLKEISWAQDKKFTSLLKAGDGRSYTGRSSQIKFTIENRSKALSNAQKGNAKTNEAKPRKSLALQKRPGPKVTVGVKKHLTDTKSKPQGVLSAIVNKKVQKSNFFYKKRTITKKPPDDEDSNIRYKINPAYVKMLNSVPKPVSRKKASHAIPSRHKDSPEPVPSLDENISVVPSKKVKKFQDTCSSRTSNLMAQTENPFERLSMWGNLFQSPENNLMSVLQRRQELRVTLEPLQSDLSMFPQVCDELDQTNEVIYTRRSLQQSMLRVFTGIDQKHISSVLRDTSDTKLPATSNSKASRKRKYDEESVRSSVRQSECAFRYKEIVVRKHDDYIQIVLVPNMYKQNCLTIEAMKELKEAFLSARKDTNCKAVLLNSSGTYFCSGIDLSQLYGSNKKVIAEEMAITIRDLILTLAIFPKPVVAAVNGYAIGLGVTLLTFCDIVLSSDKATFCIPSAKLGYIPEGGALLTLPQVVGSTVAIEMLLQGTRLTAEQALKHGLVSEVLWPTQLMEEVVPRILSLVKQPLHVMEATKTMVRCHLWEKLAVQLNQEWRMLPNQWLSSSCQQNIKQHLQTGWQLD